jgi:hypothetical protein
MRRRAVRSMSALSKKGPFRRSVSLIADVVIVALLLALGARDSTAEGELVMVVHANNKYDPNTNEFKRLFVGDTMFWPGNVPVKLYVRPVETPAGNTFFHTIHIAPPRFRRLWQEKQLSGQGTVPEIVVIVWALVGKVASDPGAIGFAMADELPTNPPGVRILPLR